MSAPRPPLRLVGSTGKDDEQASGPADREPGVAEAAEREDEAQDPPRTSLSPRLAIAVLIVFQLLAASTYLGRYAALARSDDQYGFAAALSALATLCLVAGAVSLALRPGRGRAPFIAAAVGFGLALPAWGVGYGWSWPIAFGAMLALAGAWFARPELRPDEASAAQP